MEHGLTSDRLIVMSDEQLEEQVAVIVEDVAEHSVGLSDALSVLMDEVFERFTPEAAIASLKHAYRDEPLGLQRALQELSNRQTVRIIRNALQ